jgi:two-component system, chemotaxis family, CheB/CheR fusion protein
MVAAGRQTPSFVVGIGASAGGLEAVTELLGALPRTGMAYIVVQHLDPTHESLLSEILAKKTAIPVSLAVANEVLRPDHVYVIPADAILTVRDGHIDLKRRTSAAERPSPVDVLFTSLAFNYADAAIGVVLSGGDADGSAGIREIKHAGGFTFAQRPDTARFPTMPRHAIETGCVDLVLRPSEIAAEIAHFSRPLQGDDAALDSAPKGMVDGAIDGDSESARLRHIFHRVRSAHGVDFTHYKRTTIQRRIERRMTLRRIETLDAIVDISLPGIHGIDLARRLRQMFPPEQLLLIALTGYAGAGVREACLKAGFDEHLVKPGEIALLERLLARGTDPSIQDLQS